MNEREIERLRRVMGFDQVTEQFKETGAVLFAHYTAMLDSGFTKKQAWELTQQFYDAVFSRQFKDKP